MFHLADMREVFQMVKFRQIKNFADVLNRFFSGIGLRNLSRELDVSPATLYRRLSEKTEEIYSVVIGGLRNSRLYDINLEFGDIWEVDEKVLPVNAKLWRRTGYPISRFKRKKGRQVAEVSIVNIFDLKTHFCLVSEPLLNNSGEEIARALLLAKERIGRWPVIIKCDNTFAHIEAYKRYVPKQTRLEVLPKLGEVSQLHLAEGYHRFMDLRKLDSGIHGASLWIVHGNLLHYNFVERKANLNNLTPFEVAIHSKLLTENGWEFLLYLTEKVKQMEQDYRESRLFKATEVLQKDLKGYLGLV